MPVGQTEIAKIFDDFLAKRKVKDAVPKEYTGTKFEQRKVGNKFQYVEVSKQTGRVVKVWLEESNLEDFENQLIGMKNYLGGKTKDKLREMKYQGLEIVIENEVGSKRNWVDEKGETGTIIMKIPYGYIKGVKGNDGDELDCFIGNNPYAKSVYPVRQINSLGYDEEKIMLGFDSIEEAKEAYLLHVNKEELLGDITEVPFKLFKETLDFVY